MATRRPVSRNHATRKPGTKKSQKKTGRISVGAATSGITTSNLGFEEAVIKHILQSSPQVHRVSREALLFGSLISSISPSMRETYYKSGERVGRSIYRLNAAQKEYLMPEESVADLVAFFELTGYKNITYSAYNGGKVSIEFHGDGKPSHTGQKLHMFESGIISGYLTAAKGQLVNVSENSCMGSDGEACRFVESIAPDYASASSTGGFDELAEIVKRKSMLPEEPDSSVAGGYHSLVYLPVLEKEYSDYMRQIALYMGSAVGSRIAAAQESKKGKISIRSIERAIKLLNMGSPIVKSIRPLDMRVSFDELASRQGFVDISLSFINGLLSSSLAGKAVATENVRDGHYIVEIKSAGK